MGLKNTAVEQKNTAVGLKNTLWLERNGTVREEICVYFYNTAPSNLRFMSDCVTNQLVVSMVNSKWNCADVENKNRQQIGGHVPRFKLVERKEDADIRVKFGSMLLIKLKLIWQDVIHLKSSCKVVATYSL